MSETPEQIASARADWAAAGHDVATFDAAVAGLPAATTQAPPGEPPSDKPSASAAIWSIEHAREMVADLRAQQVPDASLRAALAADGFKGADIDALLAATAADTRSDEQRSLDQSGLQPGRAADFRPIDYMGRAPEGDVFAFNADAVTFLQAIEAPALLGPSLVEEVLDASKTYAAVPEANRLLWHMTEEGRVTDLLGPEKARDAYASVAALLTKGIANGSIPESFAAWLHGSGALRRADVIVQLANIAGLAGVRAAFTAA